MISRKFNVVDRVWKAPTSTDLPRVPKLSEDAMVPENAWLRMPHIAVNGMTNCGKSSLINHVVRWNYAAKASSRAGRTTSTFGMQKVDKPNIMNRRIELHGKSVRMGYAIAIS